MQQPGSRGFGYAVPALLAPCRCCSATWCGLLAHCTSEDRQWLSKRSHLGTRSVPEVLGTHPRTPEDSAFTPLPKSRSSRLQSSPAQCKQKALPSTNCSDREIRAPLVPLVPVKLLCCAGSPQFTPWRSSWFPFHQGQREQCGSPWPHSIPWSGSS